MSQDNFHVDRQQVEHLVRDELPPEERRRVVRHLLSGCGPCTARVRQLLLLDEQADYTAVLRRLELAAVLARNDVEVERRLGAEAWERVLKPVEAGRRLLAVQTDADLRTWGLHELVLKESGGLMLRDPIAAVDLAYLALAIAESLDPLSYGEEQIQNYRAAACTALANAKRLVGDFSGAREALDAAGAALARGTGDPLEEANMISIGASLQNDQGDLAGSTKALDRAIRLARRVGDNHLAAQLTIKQSSNIGWLDPERGLALAERGLRWLGKTADPHLELCGRHLLAVWSLESGKVREARSILEAHRPLYAKHSDVFWTGRLLDLDGRITRSEGDLAGAESFFRNLMTLYDSNGFGFDQALAALDLAEVLGDQGKWTEAAALLSPLQPVLRSWNLGTSSADWNARG